MTLQDLVPPQELCQRLKEAGFPQDTAYYWHSLVSHDLKSWSDYKLQDYKPESDFGMRVIAAPTLQEVLDQLPVGIRIEKVVTGYHTDITIENNTYVGVTEGTTSIVAATHLYLTLREKKVL